MSPLSLVLRAVRALAAWADGEGDPLETARLLIDVAIATGVPSDELRDYLTEAAAKRVEAIADMAQLAKVGPRP